MTFDCDVNFATTMQNTIQKTKIDQLKISNVRQNQTSVTLTSNLSKNNSILSIKTFICRMKYRFILYTTIDVEVSIIQFYTHDVNQLFID